MDIFCLLIVVLINGEKTVVMAIVHLTKSEFEKRVSPLDAGGHGFKYIGDKPALIDFYADWCGPCRMLAPVLDELSEEYDEKVLFYKVNVDEESTLSTYFSIRSIPTLLFISLDGMVQRVSGAMSAQQLRDAIGKYLLKSG